MTIDKFNELVDYIFEERVKRVMCSKSAEYARGKDKLHNFKRAAAIDGITPLEALRGMHLKHRTSISDMLDDLMKDLHHDRGLWEEKLTDTVNYYMLMWALISESEKWKI
jgi:hypothetical protein